MPNIAFLATLLLLSRYPFIAKILDSRRFEQAWAAILGEIYRLLQRRLQAGRRLRQAELANRILNTPPYCRRCSPAGFWTVSEILHRVYSSFDFGHVCNGRI